MQVAGRLPVPVTRTEVNSVEISADHNLFKFERNQFISKWAKISGLSHSAATNTVGESSDVLNKQQEQQMLK